LAFRKYRLTGVPAADNESLASYVFGFWQFRTNLRPCKLAFGLNAASINSIRYNTNHVGRRRFSFSDTPFLMAGLRMLPMYWDDKLVLNYTLSDLVRKGEETLKELQQRRKHIVGADLNSPTEPIPELPYILVLWIFLAHVPGYYLSVGFRAAGHTNEIGQYGRRALGRICAPVSNAMAVTSQSRCYPSYPVASIILRGFGYSKPN
jgi:hypothetical protein